MLKKLISLRSLNNITTHQNIEAKTVKEILQIFHSTVSELLP